MHLFFSIIFAPATLSLFRLGNKLVVEPNRYVLQSLSLSLPRKHSRTSGLNEVDIVEDPENAGDT